MRPAGPLDQPQEIEGAALEGLIAQHLRAWAAYGDADVIASRAVALLEQTDARKRPVRLLGAGVVGLLLSPGYR